MMDARSIIAALRDGQGIGADAARWFAEGLASGTVSDAQAGAFAMAVVLNGIGEEGRIALTGAMRDSGQVLRWVGPCSWKKVCQVLGEGAAPVRGSLRN